jgi:hypothetical protein
MLPSLFLKLVGLSLLIFGVYDFNLYCYAITKGEGTFDFFGRNLPASHSIVRVGFTSVLVFYFLIGSVLMFFG